MFMRRLRETEQVIRRKGNHPKNFPKLHTCPILADVSAEFGEKPWNLASSLELGEQPWNLASSLNFTQVPPGIWTTRPPGHQKKKKVLQSIPFALKPRDIRLIKFSFPDTPRGQSENKRKNQTREPDFRPTSRHVARVWFFRE